MRSIFAYTYLDASILPAGYIDWASPPRYSNLTLQAEYKNYGPGFNSSARAKASFDRQLTAKEWSVYSAPEKVLQTREGGFGEVNWVDFAV